MRNSPLSLLRWDVPRARTRILTALTVIAAAGFLGCEDDVVYQDRPPFNPPADAAASFLGYYDPTIQKTTCGNCHADFEGSWTGTAHAHAYNTINSNPNKKDSCFGCHTTNGRGNAAVGTTAGWDGVQSSVYHDVQCESCHGAGLQHVEGIGQGNLVRPLAKLGLNGTGNCGDCHTGAHHGFVDEWKQSRHANLDVGRASNPSCTGCHEARGALAKWGVDANYVEKANPTDYQPPATCATCHDPHGSPNEGQLRYPISSTDPEQNLCVKCHLRVAQPSPPSTVKPHAPQGAVLLGFAGWRPPGFTYDTNRIYGSHATTKNPKLCAGCHVFPFEVTDPATGNFVFSATGHLFRPIPCLDAQGKPTADKTCDYSTAARSWQSCTQSGCHQDATVAAAAFNSERDIMKLLTGQLWSDLNKSGSIDPAPTDGGLLATLKATQPAEWTTDALTPAEGAEFNARLCGEYGSGNADNSKGVHNPFLCEALLTSTFSYLKVYYPGLADVAGIARASMESLTAPRPSTQRLMSGVMAHARRVAGTGPGR